MKAIDFSCHLLLNISRDSLTTMQWLVLLCIISGMATSEELADFTGRSVSTCTCMLRLLENRGLLRKISQTREVYLSTAEGKEKARELLTFISGKI